MTEQIQKPSTPPVSIMAALVIMPLLYLLGYGPYVRLTNGGWLSPVDGPVLQTL